MLSLNVSCYLTIKCIIFACRMEAKHERSMPLVARARTAIHENRRAAAEIDRVAGCFEKYASIGVKDKCLLEAKLLCELAQRHEYAMATHLNDIVDLAKKENEEKKRLNEEIKKLQDGLSKAHDELSFNESLAAIDDTPENLLESTPMESTTSAQNPMESSVSVDPKESTSDNPVESTSMESTSDEQAERKKGRFDDSSVY